jgi:hypothetical protein
MEVSPQKMEESDEEVMDEAEPALAAVPLPNLLEARVFMLVQVGDKEEEKQLKRYILAYPFDLQIFKLFSLIFIYFWWKT